MFLSSDGALLLLRLSFSGVDHLSVFSLSLLKVLLHHAFHLLTGRETTLLHARVKVAKTLPTTSSILLFFLKLFVTVIIVIVVVVLVIVNSFIGS